MARQPWGLKGQSDQEPGREGDKTAWSSGSDLLPNTELGVQHKNQMDGLILNDLWFWGVEARPDLMAIGSQYLLVMEVLFYEDLLE